MWLRNLTIALALLLSAGGLARAGTGVVIYGAGGTFPSPIYAWWSLQYARTHDARILYDAVGSGEGIARITDRKIDFGASDMPLPAPLLARQGLIQFPMLLDGVVPLIHVPGVPYGRIRLSGPVLADIFLGRIRRWNAPEIVALNPGLGLPDLAITVVHRIRDSGTTWIFTRYLSEVSPRWRGRFGVHARIVWPVGTGAMGNGGMADKVRATDGAIGYCTYADMRQSHSDYALVQNRAGRFVRPGQASFRAAAARMRGSSRHAPLLLTDNPGTTTWPIVGATFILMPRVPHDPILAAASLRFFDWCYAHGGPYAEKLDYVPLPPAMVNTVRRQWRQGLRTREGRPLWPPRQHAADGRSAAP